MRLERLFPSVLAAMNRAERGRCYSGLDDQGGFRGSTSVKLSEPINSLLRICIPTVFRCEDPAVLGGIA